MSSKPSAAQSLLAGLFLLTGLVALVVGAFWIQGQSFGGPRSEFTIVLELDTGSGGLEKDAAVEVGGKRKGRVLAVEVMPRTNLTGRPNFDVVEAEAIKIQPDERLVVVVDVELDADVVLHPGTKVLLDIPLLGSGGALNIAYTGNPSLPPLAEGSVIMANVSPPPFLRGLDVNEVGEAVSEIKLGAAKFRTFMEALAPLDDGAIEPGSWAKRIDSVLANTDELVADVRTDAWPAWKAEVDQTLANAREFSAKLDSYGERYNAAADEARNLFADGRTLLGDNREQIDTIVDNVDRFTADANQTWGPGIQSAVTRAEEAFGEFADLGQDMNVSWDGFRPNIDQALARFRLGADQFKLFTVEVRSQPWRLLHRPDTKELESQLLYDASRSYAQAVSDLRATSASLESVLTGWGSGQFTANSPRNAEQVQELMAELQRTRDRQAQAERRLLELMTEYQKGLK